MSLGLHEMNLLITEFYLHWVGDMGVDPGIVCWRMEHTSKILFLSGACECGSDERLRISNACRGPNPVGRPAPRAAPRAAPVRAPPQPGKQTCSIFYPLLDWSF